MLNVYLALLRGVYVLGMLTGGQCAVDGGR
jgi:hypothetical protein